MERHWAYCSACDRQVEVVIKPREAEGEAAGDGGDEIVCLEVGHTCTGALCPITDVPPEDMRRALRGIETKGEAVRDEPPRKREE
jgi:hypothetical protein